MHVGVLAPAEHFIAPSESNSLANAPSLHGKNKQNTSPHTSPTTSSKALKRRQKFQHSPKSSRSVNTDHIHPHTTGFPCLQKASRDAVLYVCWVENISLWGW